MSFLKLYNTYEETTFLERPNRFVMRLHAKDGRIIEAHVPNTGRMEEFCVDDHPFFVTPVSHGKYQYKVIATMYQGEYVFLDTIKVNAIFEQLLCQDCIQEFYGATNIRREVTVDDSKFDFAFVHNRQNVLVEVKSCTLCHNRLAMFPDAPTIRGQRHLATLERLAEAGDFDTYVVFLILNASAKRFMPNFHTDFDYGKLFLSARHVNIKALRLSVATPVTVDLSSVQEIPIDYPTLSANCQNKGSYLLVLENADDVDIHVGRLGTIHLSKGWYVYVGSALNSLDSRLKRHRQKRKKHFWHIDYVASTVMKVKKVYPIRRTDRIESDLAQTLEHICETSIPGFGASDARESSHLFYFSTYPWRYRAFVDLLFTARTL
jgi:sugar fermentation stimulation protein A